MAESCSGCDTCQTCNSCQSCNNGCNTEGDDVCNTAQTLCEQDCETYSEYGTFNFNGDCYSSGQIIGPGYFDKESWDDFIDNINKALEAGEEANSGDAIALSTTDAIAPFTASEYNRIADAVGCSRQVTKDDVIYGTYFSELVTSAEDAKISSEACDSCNTNCDSDCTECQKCNEDNTDGCGTSEQPCCEEDNDDEEGEDCTTNYEACVGNGNAECAEY